MAMMEVSPSVAPSPRQPPPAAVKEQLITWRELRKLYDFDDKVNASGGYGSIFVGTKVATMEDVVLKVVNAHSCAFRRFRYLTPEVVEELRRYVFREWTFLSTLSHPHIVSPKDEVIYRIQNACRCGGDHSALADKEHDDVYVIVMERMEMDLYDQMHYWRAYCQSPSRLKLTSFNQLVYSRLPPLLARKLFYQICKALDYLHERPILHRDLSWGNIMIKRDAHGQVVAKLVDLGLSRDLPGTPSGLSIENIGTLAFCAPELYYSELKTCGYGSRIDVWSLGVCLFLMLTGNSDPNERSLRFRNMIDALENDHDLCIESREHHQHQQNGHAQGKGKTGTASPTSLLRTCMFCEELLNSRFAEAISAEEMAVKHRAVTLLEGMLKVTPDERLSIKQVLGHPWLDEERARDPEPLVDTDEEAALFDIPRGGHGAPLRVEVRIMEFPYLRDPECAIFASSYRDQAGDVKLGDVTTFGGILSRVGVPTGERMLQALPRAFGPEDYVVNLDPCIPRKSRGKYFRRAYLCLLDRPNDRRSIYSLYRALRLEADLGGSRSAIMPLIGFDFKFEPGSPYQGRVGETGRKRFVLQHWLSHAYHLAQTFPGLEALALSSWKRSTFTLVKELLGSPLSRAAAEFHGDDDGPAFLPLPALFDDEAWARRLRGQAEAVLGLYQQGACAAVEGLKAAVEEQLLPALQQCQPGFAPHEAAVCRAVGAIGRLLLGLALRGGGGGGESKSGGEGGDDEEEEDLFLALLTMEGGIEKLELFGDGHLLINRVDVSRSLDSLLLVLGRCAAGRLV